MLKFTGSALALLVAFSIVPLAHSEAGNRSERHRIIKHSKFRMVDRSGHRDRRHVRRIVNRNVVVVKVNVNGRRHHRHHSYGDYYSGGIVIGSRNGVGQWSYSLDATSIVAAPSAKIIDVGTLKPDSVCEMQAGVCVIKP